MPNWLDIVFAIVLIASVLEGLKKGFARTALGLAAVIVGLVGGLWFYGSVGALFGTHVGKTGANVLGFLIIFVGVILVGALLGALIARLLKMVHLSWLDRLAGGAFGVLRGALVCAVIVAVMMAFSSQPPPGPVANSRLAPYVMGTARIMVYAAPHEFSEGFHRSYDKLRALWDDVTHKKGDKPETDEL
jgi:membrane protein required for colicin V production